MELELSEPVAGVLRLASGEERLFRGWLEMHAALEHLFAHATVNSGGGSVMFKARAIGISVVVTAILGVVASPASASRSVTWEVPSSCIDSEGVVTADPPPGQPARSARGG